MLYGIIGLFARFSKNCVVDMTLQRENTENKQCITKIRESYVESVKHLSHKVYFIWIVHKWKGDGNSLKELKDSYFARFPHRPEKSGLVAFWSMYVSH